MSKVTTEDCKEAIKEWYKDNNKVQPGEFKRIKKFKNENGEVVRHFEHKESETLLKVIEKPDYLDVSSASELVGKGYLFGFGVDETYDEADGNVCFYVVEKTFFEENGHIDSVHFTDQFDMPYHLEEVMESCFLVMDSTKEAVRKELLALGFTESKELTEMLND